MEGQPEHAHGEVDGISAGSFLLFTLTLALRCKPDYPYPGTPPQNPARFHAEFSVPAPAFSATLAKSPSSSRVNTVQPSKSSSHLRFRSALLFKPPVRSIPSFNLRLSSLRPSRLCVYSAVEVSSSRDSILHPPSPSAQFEVRRYAIRFNRFPAVFGGINDGEAGACQPPNRVR